MIKQVPLHQTHAALGARFFSFAGYDMPIKYQSEKSEHMKVREEAGLFDVSHMGEFIIRGPKALALIQKVSSNDASTLPDGKAQYACLPNHEGGIVDDMIVYHIREDQYMLVVNAANIQKDWEWISKSNTMDAEMIDVSDRTALLALSGPKAESILQPLTSRDLSTMGTYECYKETFQGAEKTLIATTGYTGERTFEIFLYQEHAQRIWDILMESGEGHGLVPVGLGARDTLRLEMGYMLYGNDINDQTSPIEAGLGWITKLKKGSFNGSEQIAASKAAGISRKLVGLEMEDRGIPRSGYKILHEGEAVGEITSGSLSPVLNKGIGLGYVPTSLAKPGTELAVQIRNKACSVRVVKTPFIRK